MTRREMIFVLALAILVMVAASGCAPSAGTLLAVNTEKQAVQNAADAYEKAIAEQGDFIRQVRRDVRDYKKELGTSAVETLMTGNPVDGTKVRKAVERLVEIIAEHEEDTRAYLTQVDRLVILARRELEKAGLLRDGVRRYLEAQGRYAIAPGNTEPVPAGEQVDRLIDLLRKLREELKHAERPAETGRGVGVGNPIVPDAEPARRP